MILNVRALGQQSDGCDIWNILRKFEAIPGFLNSIGA